MSVPVISLQTWKGIGIYELPTAVHNLHDDAGALVQPLVISLTHIDNAIVHMEIFDMFQSPA
jgi:hypothetical protein